MVFVFPLAPPKRDRPAAVSVYRNLGSTRTLIARATDSIQDLRTLVDTAPNSLGHLWKTTNQVFDRAFSPPGNYSVNPFAGDLEIVEAPGISELRDTSPR